MPSLKRFSQRAGYSSLAELNITPMLDLAFTLLIVFIVASPALEQSVNLNLPIEPANPSTPLAPEAVRTVAVNAAGAIFVDGQPFRIADLREELIAWKAREPEAAVILRVDRSVSFQYVNDVFDAMTRAGISRLSIVNTPAN
jgi:biopolymer transport protein ExbD